MELVTPSIGLIVWQTLAFLLLLFLLAKFAWKPVLKGLHEREHSIETALQSAENAKAEMARLTSENESLLKQARAERDMILKEAKELKDKIVGEAKSSAQIEGAKMIEKAQEEINSQKAAALAEIKGQVSELSLQIAEKVLRTQLQDKSKQEALVSDLLKDVKLN